jgi:LemA protein
MVLSIILWLIIALIVLIILIFISYFNRFAILVNRIENSASQIDVQLKKRADLVPNLIETVKGYAKHEKGIMTSVTNARKALLGAKSLNEKVKAGNKLQDALKSIIAIGENYPQLRASENFKNLQEELSAIENKIAYARQFFNDSILTYDNLRSTFPGVLFANMFGKKELPYLKIEEAERKNVKVKF